MENLQVGQQVRIHQRGNLYTGQTGTIVSPGFNRGYFFVDVTTPEGRPHQTLVKEEYLFHVSA
jgi:hypothetical protein